MYQEYKLSLITAIRLRRILQSDLRGILAYQIGSFLIFRTIFEYGNKETIFLAV